MKVQVLGCSGGVGGPSLRTTALLVDQDVLVDCGTGVGDLSVAQLAQIDHIFITHTHLDHIACLPLLLDTVCDLRDQPVQIYARVESLRALQQHLFNGELWPDFSEMPSREQPYLRYVEVREGISMELNNRRFTPLPASHTVPALGYWLDSGVSSLVFTGDTGPCAALWQAINHITNLRYLIIETAFPNHDGERASASMHFSPQSLVSDLMQLEREAEIFISHLKPGLDEIIMREIADLLAAPWPRMLKNGHEFVF